MKKSKQIVEGNELIARFMDISDFKTNEYNRFFVNRNNDMVGWYDFNDLEYDTSLDWMGPVISKIETIKGFAKIKIGREIQPTWWCLILNDRVGKIIMHGSLDKKEAIYKAVIEFIKWYNDQSPSS